MRVTAFVLLLSLVFLSFAALAGGSITPAARTEASSVILADNHASRGAKTEVPGLMSFQGTLTDEHGVAMDTTVSMAFSIYTDSTGGSLIWTETQTAVVVSSGMFNVLLGRVNSISDTVFKDPERWIGVQVGADPELQPRQRIAAVGYAFQSSTGGSDVDWTISGDDMYSGVSGNVGIGMASPQAKLHVDGTMRLGAGAARYEIREVTPWSGGGWQNYIDYGGIGIGSNDGNQRQMIMFTDGAGSNNIFTAATSENGGSTWEADFVIQQDGNVGIGTESPAAKLDVSGDVNINSVYKIGTETVLSARGTDNIFVGAGAGENNAGDNGTFVGFAAGASNEGNDNTFVGREVGKNHTTGSINTYIGTIAGYFDTEGQNNTFIGGGAGFLNTTGSENTYVGTFAGNSNQVGVGNVFIGYQAGYNETDSSKLYIANGPDTSDVLIYGDFSTGNVGLGTLDPAEKLDINGTTQMTGFKMPTGASDGYVLTSDGSGVGSWQTPSATDNDWVRSTPDSVLFTAHLLGIARGGAGNRLYGDEVHTHINFGITCTTGTSGENDSYCTIGGGICNSAGAGATVAGGYHNAARDYWATVGGGVDNTASGGVATVGGGNSNTASGDYAIVSGGYNNTAGGADATVGGGYFNAANGDWSTVGGGAQNTASGADATVGGGESNTASDQYATVGGGASNTASYLAATVGGGEFNLASGYAATVGGGYRDTSAAGYSFTVGSYSMVAADYSNSVAFNGQTATASGQTRVGTISKASGTFTIDHPLDPTDKILNHYFVESPEMVLIYRGAATIGADSRAEVHLPDYFDALNQNPMVQLTGVGTAEVVYVAEKVKGNRFVIGGKPGTEVYWTVTAERKDQSAEITKILMPVEQPKDGSLAGRSLDDDFLATTMMQLERMGQADMFDFRTQRGRARYEDSRRAIENR